MSALMFSVTDTFFGNRLILTVDNENVMNSDAQTCVETSFMMMNQVDSSSFDDDKKPKRMISRLSQQVQDQV